MNPTIEMALMMSGPSVEVHKVSPKACVFLPADDFMYIPVVIHIALSDCTLEMLNAIRGVLEDDVPPIVVFTATHETRDMSPVISLLEEQEYTREDINFIISPCNRMVPTGCFGSLHDNLPGDLKVFFESYFEQGLIEDIRASKAAEALSIALQIPSMSCNLTEDSTIDEVLSLLKFIPEYPDWEYTEYNYPESTPQGRCALCNKKRGPQKFFFKIQDRLCPVCEKKIKDTYGKVSIVNLYKAKLALDKERMRTRLANVRKELMSPVHKCPKCEGQLDSLLGHKLVCLNCSSVFFHLRNGSDELLEATPQRFLYKYKGRKLTGIEPSNTQSLIQYCSSCGAPTTRGIRYPVKDGGYVTLCESCNWTLRQTINKRSEQKVDDVAKD